MKWQKLISENEVKAIASCIRAWANEHAVAIILDSNQAEMPYQLGEFQLIAAVDVLESVYGEMPNAFETIKSFQSKHAFCIGWLSYDLKNEIESLSSSHPDGIDFAPSFLFVPKTLIRITNNLLLSIETTDDSTDPEQLWNTIQSCSFTQKLSTSIVIQQRTSKENYIQRVDQIKQEIREGNVYEMNYCIEFFATPCSIDPLSYYHQLIERSPVPFGAFVKHHQQYVLCASPERFLCIQNEHVYSQPIKGTAARGKNETEDIALKHALRYSEKEIAENLMIVDLVRNDLAISCVTGSIRTPELFHIYTYPQVHQMISTIEGIRKPNLHIVDIIKNAFPMGSMTGAPKLSAMQFIESFEEVKRGLYSGCIGYLEGNEKADFNVVIRSIQFNAKTGYLNFMVGSAITIDSDAEAEYAECLLKAKAMLHVLGAQIH